MRVNWVDTDASVLIHYAAALRYFEVAEHELMRRPFAEIPAWGAVMLRRAQVEPDYSYTVPTASSPRYSRSQ